MSPRSHVDQVTTCVQMLFNDLKVTNSSSAAVCSQELGVSKKRYMTKNT